MTRETKTFFIRVIRWGARLFALAASGPFISFLLFRSGEVVPSLSWRAPNEMPLLIAWAVMVVGIVLTWRWEMAGGLVSAVSAIAVGLLAYAGCGAAELTTCLLVASPYLVSGLVLMGCCWASERLRMLEPPAHAVA